jgi:hypothetical protein
MDGYFPLTFKEETSGEPDWQQAIVGKDKDKIITQRYYKESGKMIWHDRVDVYYAADSPTRGVRPEKIGLPPVPVKWEPLEGVEKVDIGPEGFKKVKQMMGDQGLVGAWVTSTAVLHDEESIFNYYDNPDKHEKWAEERVRNAEARFERIMKMEVKPDFICVGGSGTLIFQSAILCFFVLNFAPMRIISLPEPRYF